GYLRYNLPAVVIFVQPHHRIPVKKALLTGITESVAAMAPLGCPVIAVRIEVDTMNFVSLSRRGSFQEGKSIIMPATNHYGCFPRLHDHFYNRRYRIIYGRRPCT